MMIRNNDSIQRFLNTFVKGRRWSDNIMSTTTTEYKLLLSTNDDDHHGNDAECGIVSADVNAECGLEVYPGNRRTFVIEDEHDDLIFVRTGGNALTAIPKDFVEHQQTLIQVVVPEGTYPGDEILVASPFVTTTGNGGLISVTIPPGTMAGSILLVEVPAAPPNVVTGIPVDSPQPDTPIVRDSESDLALQEEAEEERRPYNTMSVLDEQEYWMREKREIV